MTSNAVQNSPFRTDVSKVYNTTTTAYSDGELIGDGGTAFTLSQNTYEVVLIGPLAVVHYTFTWSAKGSGGTTFYIDMPSAPPPANDLIAGPICQLYHTVASMTPGFALAHVVDNSGSVRIESHGINATTGVLSAHIDVADLPTGGIASGTLVYCTSYNS